MVVVVGVAVSNGHGGGVWRLLAVVLVVVVRMVVVLVMAAQPVNTYLANNWETVATQPYFDKNGSFISAIFSGPLLCVGFMYLVCGATQWQLSSGS